nr:hypothetical protein GCM10011355_04410 [Aquisalinus luteolus]
MHLEDTAHNPDYYRETTASVQTPSICSTDKGETTCQTGPESAADFFDAIENMRIRRIYVSRIAFYPPVLDNPAGEQIAPGCYRDGDNRYTVGLALERFLEAGTQVLNLWDIGTYTVEINPHPTAQTVPNGTMRYIASSSENLVPATVDQYNLFSNPALVIDRRERPRYTGARAPMGGRPENGITTIWEDYQKGMRPAGNTGPGSVPAPSTSGASSAAQPNIVTITRSATSGLTASASSASSQARSAAEGAARTACQNQGGTVVGLTSRPDGAAQKVTDTTYRASYSATARCRM